MKAAIIAPAPFLPVYATTGYHLVLSDVLRQNPRYCQFYADLEGDYVILDNSAHEHGVGDSVETLIHLSDEISANEVVLPDRLFIGQDTVEMSTEAYARIRRSRPELNVMAVPQGRTLDEWADCLDCLLQLTPIIGVSKDYEVWGGGLPALVDIVVDLGRKIWDSTLTIHMLGWGRIPGQISKLVDHPHVRGVDSAKPLVFAHAGITMPHTGILRQMEKSMYYPRRAEGFFHASHIDETIGRWNVEQFCRLVGQTSV